MACFSGPRTPYKLLRSNTGSFWSVRVLSSMWQDTAGTIPAVVDAEVKRIDDLSGNGNHLLSSTGSRDISGYIYTHKGPILHKEETQYYLEFDGDGAAMSANNLSGTWPAVTGSNSLGITLATAFVTSSTQPALPSSGYNGSWGGSDGIGNFGTGWRFGMRLAQGGVAFYCQPRNIENTLWVSQFNENDNYTLLSGATFLDRKISFVATGTISNTTLGGKEWVNGVSTKDFTTPFQDISLLPQPFLNSFVIGARNPGNDNWTAGRWYGGLIIAKELTEIERKEVEEFLYINLFV